MPVLKFLFWILVGWQGALVIWLFKRVPWWAFFFLAYFLLRLMGPEYAKYQIAMDNVVADTDPPRAPLVLVEDFDASRDLGPMNEILVQARWSEDLPAIAFDGVSVMDFTVLPLLSTAEDRIAGLAFAGKSEREQLLHLVRAGLEAGTQLPLHGRYDNVPFTDQRVQKELQRYRSRFNRLGYEIGEHLVLISPYLDGRRAELVRAAEANRFWARVLMVLAGLSLVFGTVKLVQKRRSAAGKVSIGSS